jgi:hypothetical protein
MWKRVFGLLAIVCSAPLPASVLGAPVGKAGRGELDGEWQLTALDEDGKTPPDPESLRIVIKGAS